jgi:hypothetical protein
MDDAPSWLASKEIKKWENHEAALALFFAYYNFCRVRSTIKSTPAVAAGWTDHTWSVKELLEEMSGTRSWQWIAE